MKTGTTPTNIAGRIGRWSARHWKTATFGWLAFIVAAFMIGNVVKTNQLDPAKAGNGESGHVQAVLADEWKQPKTEAVIVQSKHGSSHDASFRVAVDDLINRLEGMKQVQEVKSPYAAGNSPRLNEMSRFLPEASVPSHQCLGRTVISWPMIFGSSRLPGPSNVNLTSRSPTFSALMTCR